MHAAARIDSVRAGASGRIGMVPFPGGPWFQRPPPAPRDALSADLRALRDWGASVLVSLVEARELELLGLSDLGTRAADSQLIWRHLPIRDMCPPGAGFERRWPSAGEELRQVLRDGGRIVLHCYAGLGRTGTVAARLLVEMGMPPTQAVRRVRAARPGTIQTPQQEQHVLRTPCPLAPDAR